MGAWEYGTRNKPIKHATGQLLTDFIFQGLICLPQQSDDPTLIRTNCLLEVSDDLESQSPPPRVQGRPEFKLTYNPILPRGNLEYLQC